MAKAAFEKIDLTMLTEKLDFRVSKENYLPCLAMVLHCPREIAVRGMQNATTHHPPSRWCSELKGCVWAGKTAHNGPSEPSIPWTGLSFFPVGHEKRPGKGRSERVFATFGDGSTEPSDGAVPPPWPVVGRMTLPVAGAFTPVTSPAREPQCRA